MNSKFSILVIPFSFWGLTCCSTDGAKTGPGCWECIERATPYAGMEFEATPEGVLARAAGTWKGTVEPGANSELSEVRVVVGPAMKGEALYIRAEAKESQPDCSLPDSAHERCAGIVIPTSIAAETTPAKYGFAAERIFMLGTQLRMAPVGKDEVADGEPPAGIAWVHQPDENDARTTMTLAFSPDGSLWMRLESAADSDEYEAPFQRIGEREE